MDSPLGFGSHPDQKGNQPCKQTQYLHSPLKVP